ncbi:MAG: polysaccharide biosynthesis tyrosine autokinase [Armatimonadetes bacterium]|nr:polysaccharide biosynthesis tyrosine autokinase [Armatimonadota bacterium]NIM22924.1 polysaccharide biosynthesis tyrosine autokinase [Armatimonadota bacterium]NIM66796.1 polysaccharide biosynthesis tyrosine autokinase [Armatimonadota bacterium]NIM75338.1 polysaccharide biosynthesis tyrosine autokinase [Armatimonadota bacterium]NIN04984.1 polysaccharide biosynthesis tyrosine autokinase [Armatimonadota bacterium]
MTRADLVRLYRLLRRRRWLVGAVTLGTLTIVVLGALLMPLYYRASAVVMPSEAALQNPLGRDTGTWTQHYRIDKRERDARLPAFMDLVKSHAVLQETKEKLGLETDTQDMAKLISVQPAFGVAFSITAFDRTETGAMELANELARTLAKHYRELSRSQSEEERRLLEERVERLRQAMEAAKKEVSALSGEEISVSASMENNPSFSRANALQVEVDALRAQLSEARERRLRTEKELTLQPERKESLTSTTGNPRVASLQEELARLERELVSARIRYTEKHRQVQRLEEQVDKVKASLSAALEEMTTHKTIAPNPLRTFLESELVKLNIEEAALTARLSALRATMARDQQKVRAASSKEVDITTSKADYLAAQESYRTVSGLLQAALIEEEAQQGAAHIRIIQEAGFAEGPSTRRGPNLVQLIVLGVLLSLGLGVGVGLAAEFFDESIRSTEDIQQVLQLPLSGTIPEVVGVEREALPQITRALPISPYAECYRFLRTSILSNGHAQSVKSLMFTAASPAQGTSTTIANLAISLSEAGKTVVLVDADLRRPMQHIIFKVPNEVGLTSVLAGDAEIEDALRHTEVPRLFVLPAGPQADNPSASLNSQRMKETLRRLQGRFEYVLIDTPPVLAFSESVTLSSLLDGAVLVVRVGDASRGNELQAKATLEKAGAKILGVVVNGLSPQHIDSFYFHAHYYQQAALPGRSHDDSAVARPDQ